jgi:hypothetical protein
MAFRANSSLQTEWSDLERYIARSAFTFLILTKQFVNLNFARKAMFYLFNNALRIGIYFLSIDSCIRHSAF